MKVNKLILAIGANIKNPHGLNPIETCESAIKELTKFSIRILKISSWYLSEPIPKSNHPNYYNSVIQCSTFLNEKKVLKNHKNYRKKLGRIKKKKIIQDVLILILLISIKGLKRV